MLVNSVLEAVGNTPLIRLGRMSSGNVFVKADFLNPGEVLRIVWPSISLNLRRKQGKTKSRNDHYRSDFRKYGNWIDFGGSTKRLPGSLCDA